MHPVVRAPFDHLVYQVLQQFLGRHAGRDSHEAAFRTVHANWFLPDQKLDRVIDQFL